MEIQWDAAAAEKGGYEHFMLKEIHEQPKAVQDTIGAYVKEGHIDFSETGLTDEKLASLKRIYICLPCWYGWQICDRIHGENPG